MWEEPFGLVIAEALATGTPVAAFDIGGVSEVLAGMPGTAAVMAGDVTALAHAARDLALEGQREPLTRVWTRRAAVREHALSRDRHGRVSRLIGVAKDITGEIAAQASLRDSERRYRLLAESISDVILSSNSDLQLNYVSPSAAAFFGYSPDWLLEHGLLGTVTGIIASFQALEASGAANDAAGPAWKTVVDAGAPGDVQHRRRIGAARHNLVDGSVEHCTTEGFPAPAEATHLRHDRHTIAS